jgi:hypothetical protein
MAGGGDEQEQFPPVLLPDRCMYLLRNLRFVRLLIAERRRPSDEGVG